MNKPNMPTCYERLTHTPICNNTFSHNTGKLEYGPDGGHRRRRRQRRKKSSGEERADSESDQGDRKSPPELKVSQTTPGQATCQGEAGTNQQKSPPEVLGSPGTAGLAASKGVASTAQGVNTDSNGEISKGPQENLSSQARQGRAPTRGGTGTAQGTDDVKHTDVRGIPAHERLASSTSPGLATSNDNKGETKSADIDHDAEVGDAQSNMSPYEATQHQAEHIHERPHVEGHNGESDEDAGDSSYDTIDALDSVPCDDHDLCYLEYENAWEEVQFVEMDGDEVSMLVADAHLDIPTYSKSGEGKAESKGGPESSATGEKTGVRGTNGQQYTPGATAKNQMGGENEMDETPHIPDWWIVSARSEQKCQTCGDWINLLDMIRKDRNDDYSVWTHVDCKSHKGSPGHHSNRGTVPSQSTGGGPLKPPGGGHGQDTPQQRSTTANAQPRSDNSTPHGSTPAHPSPGQRNRTTSSAEELVVEKLTPTQMLRIIKSRHAALLRRDVSVKRKNEQQTTAQAPASTVAQPGGDPAQNPIKGNTSREDKATLQIPSLQDGSGSQTGSMLRPRGTGGLVSSEQAARPKGTGELIEGSNIGDGTNMYTNGGKGSMTESELVNELVKQQLALKKIIKEKNISGGEAGPKTSGETIDDYDSKVGGDTKKAATKGNMNMGTTGAPDEIGSMEEGQCNTTTEDDYEENDSFICDCGSELDSDKSWKGMRENADEDSEDVDYYDASDSEASYSSSSSNNESDSESNDESVDENQDDNGEGGGGEAVGHAGLKVHFQRARRPRTAKQPVRYTEDMCEEELDEHGNPVKSEWDNDKSEHESDDPFGSDNDDDVSIRTENEHEDGVVDTAKIGELGQQEVVGTTKKDTGLKQTTVTQCQPFYVKVNSTAFNSTTSHANDNMGQDNSENDNGDNDDLDDERDDCKDIDTTKKKDNDDEDAHNID